MKVFSQRIRAACRVGDFNYYGKFIESLKTTRAGDNVDLFFTLVIKLICLYVGIKTIHGLLLLSNAVMVSIYPAPLPEKEEKLLEEE